MSDDEVEKPEEIDEDVKEIMKSHDLDKDTAERAQELIDEGLDEDDAIEVAEEGL
ncbi:MAG: hypothetical protein AAB372_02390 [Patescibacteria group bacterium]